MPATISGKWLLLYVLTMTILHGCGPAIQNPTPLGMPGTRAPYMEPEYKIHAGDTLSIGFTYTPEFNQEVIVRPDGRISLQLLNEIMAAGLTPSELTYVLTKKYAVFLRDPEVTVTVNSFAGHKIYVGGEVGGGGVYEIPGPTTLYQVITMAGGFTEYARKDQVVVIRRIQGRSRPFAMMVNMEKVMDNTDMSQDITLIPYDIVHVPKSPIGKFNEWIDAYLRQTINFLPQEFMFLYGMYRSFSPGGNQ